MFMLKKTAFSNEKFEETARIKELVFSLFEAEWPRMKDSDALNHEFSKKSQENDLISETLWKIEFLIETFDRLEAAMKVLNVWFSLFTALWKLEFIMRNRLSLHSIKESELSIQRFS